VKGHDILISIKIINCPQKNNIFDPKKHVREEWRILHNQKVCNLHISPIFVGVLDPKDHFACGG
jgi:hypothetical protein